MRKFNNEGFKKFLTENKLTETSKLLNEAKYGFDLTEISARNWKEALESVGIRPLDYSLVDIYRSKKSEIESLAWEWSAPGIKVFTANNPITGEHAGGSGRNEKGYASYIGIEGDSRKVERLASEIKERAEYIKDKSPGRRDFI